MYLRASEMSKQAWSEAVKTNNLDLYYSFGDKEQKCWGGASKCWGVQNMLGGGCTNEVGGGGGCAPPRINGRRSCRTAPLFIIIGSTANHSEEKPSFHPTRTTHLGMTQIFILDFANIMKWEYI